MERLGFMERRVEAMGAAVNKGEVIECVCV